MRIRDQARIQVRGRDADAPKYELLEPFGSDHGLALLPAPSPGDIFLDLEGDHFAKDGGREYLIGYVTSDPVGSTKYTALWATDPHQERIAFEHFVDFAIATWQQDLGMHIYHFAPYEPTALKRLMSRHASREIELDRLLRGERFVDLHTVLKRSLRASVERYSLKDLEPFHQFKRTEDLRRATACRHAIELALEFGQFDGALAEHVAHVERYNEEDCLSAKALRDWLEKLRQEVIDNGHGLPRPGLKTGDASEKLEERDQQIRELRAKLLDGISEEPSERTPEQQAQWLMAHLLEWHRREDKPVWWEYFRLRDLIDEDLIHEKAALVGLTFESRVGGTARCPIHRYRFPDQDHDIRPVSHKVIRNLLDWCVQIAREKGVDLPCIQKVKETTQDYEGPIDETKKNEAVDSFVTSRASGVAAGTAWLWARPQLRESVHVLIIDEAGQMSLANVLAVTTAAKSIVLLGDPQQLEQPQQGSHPEGTHASALEHILGDNQTMPVDRGLFLDTTWRLHPKICTYTSEVFYEGRLRSRPNLSNQKIDGPTRFKGAGLWFAPVNHEGNQTRAIEEVKAIRDIVDDLLQPGVNLHDEKGECRPLSHEDILIVAPYNAQVSAILHALPDYRVGTVDRFQGQQAPVVVYSMTTSAPEEAPRGLNFLYSRNRLNVATSRAQAVCILVGSPKLFEPNCTTPLHMKLVNSFCRYLEIATRV